MGNTADRGYERRLTLFDGLMVVVGGIIGAGIFLNPSIVAQRLSTSSLVLMVWTIGGMIALVGALCFGELGARRPEAGGGYVYLREAFGPLPAFLYGWTLLLIINTGAIAAVAMTFAFYANDLMGMSGYSAKPLAIGAVILLTGINYFGIKAGSITQNIFTVLKLGAVAVLTVAGLLLFGESDGSLFTSHQLKGDNFGMIGNIGVALVPVLFAFGGWQHVNHIAGEIKNPRRNLPMSTFFGVLIVVVCYLLVNIAYVSSLGVEGLASSTVPASDVTQSLWGAAGSKVISAGIAISTFGFVNLAILAGARVYQAMANDGLFFKKAARLHAEYRTPSFSLIIQGIWIIILILSGSYAQLLDYTVFGDWIFFGLVVGCIFYYRSSSRHSLSSDEFEMPGYPWLPILFILSCIFVVISSILSNLVNAMIGAGLILAGIPVYLYWKNKTDNDET